MSKAENESKVDETDTQEKVKKRSRGSEKVRTRSCRSLFLYRSLFEKCESLLPVILE